MAEYLISFNAEWTDHVTDDDVREASRRVKALRKEMTEAGVLIFLGGLDLDAPVFSVDAARTGPMVSDGPYAESKEHLGGFTIVDVPDDAAATSWAVKVAQACGWPQEVRRSQAVG
jgi:hypothetical protein